MEADAGYVSRPTAMDRLLRRLKMQPPDWRCTVCLHLSCHGIRYFEMSSEVLATATHGFNQSAEVDMANVMELQQIVDIKACLKF